MTWYRAKFLQYLAEIVLNSQSLSSRRNVHGDKSDRVQSAGLNVLWPGEGVSFTKTDSIR